MRRPRGSLLGTWLVVAVLVVSSSLATVIQPRVALAQGTDPQRVSLTQNDLRPGFRPKADETGSREPIQGVQAYQAKFTREASRDNINSGPVEITSLVARTSNEQQAKDQFASSRQALLSADPKWTESSVAKLGDQATGLTAHGSMEGGAGVAHLYLLQKGPMIVGITVAGLEAVTKMAEAEALAAIVLRRIDPQYANARAPAGGTRSLGPQQPGSSGSSSTTGSSSSASPSRTGTTTTPTSSTGSTQATQQSSGSQSGTRVRVANTDGGRLRLRAEPSTSATIVAHFTPGTVLDVIGEDRQAEGRTWKNVRGPGNATGWVAAEYTTAVTASAPGAPGESSARSETPL